MEGQGFTDRLPDSLEASLREERPRVSWGGLGRRDGRVWVVARELGWGERATARLPTAFTRL